MQNLLLTIASAIILAVAAAFAAPFVVDWTQWRAVFEAQAARAIGAPVVIRGPIEAQILPTPHIVLRDVSVGVDGGGTGMAAAELAGHLSLGALMRGEVVADRLTLTRPRLRVVVDATGKFVLPTGATRAAGFSIAELDIRDGTLELVDRANGRTLKLDDMDLTGALGGTLGPARLDGEVETAGVRRRLRASLATFAPDGAAKLRLGVQNVGSPFSIDADGVLSLAGGKPGFRGRASLAAATDPAPALRGADGKAPAVPTFSDVLKGWSLAGTVEASPQAVSASDLSLTLEGAQRPVELTGMASFTGGNEKQPDTRLELKLSARQIDLNAMTGGAVPLAAVDALAATIAPLAGVATSGTLDLTSDTVLLAGAAMREAQAGLDWSPAGWRARTIEARLPGGARVALSGSLPSVAGKTDPNAALFGGTVVLEAQDLPAFAGWAAPEASALVTNLPAGAARLAGELSASGSRVAFDKLDLTAGDSHFTGTAAYSVPQDGVRGRLDAVLATDNIDLDALLPSARRLIGLGTERFDLGLSLTGRQVRFAGANAKSVDVILKGGAEGLGIERLAIDDFAGLDLTGSGRLAALGSAEAGASGRFEAQLSGKRAEGLPALARAFGLTQIEPFLASAGPMLAPVDVRLVLASEAGRTSVEAGGQLGSLSGAGKVGFGADRRPQGRVQFDAKDGGAVLSRLGVPGLRGNLGAGRLVVDLGERVDATLTLGGASLRGQGSLALDAEGRVQPDLALTLDGANLAVLLSDVASGDARAVPASLKGALGRDGETWWVRGLSGSIAGQRLDGSLAYAPGQPVQAELTTAKWSLPQALSLVVGASGGEGWSKTRFGTPMLATLAAELALNVSQFELPGGLALGDARLRGKLSGGRLAAEEIAGQLAGGSLAGRFNLGREGENVQFDGRLSLANADGAALLAAAGAKQPGVRGRVTATLDLTGRGNSPFVLASRLQGQGNLAIEGLEIDYNDPTALQYVMLATDRGLPPDRQKLVQLFNEGLSRGPLRLQRVESAISVVDGVARTSAARITAGEQRFGVSGVLDIAALGFEATLELQDVAQGGLPAVPAAAVQWRGPLAAPERRFDITALTAAINMRALDRETKRLEAEFGRTPLTDGGQATGNPAVGRGREEPAPAAPAQPPASPPAAASPSRPAPQSYYYGQYSAPGAQMPGELAPGSAAPPLGPPVDIPADPLQSPIMAPPLAP
ncbi:AsmA family protein [Ancylobacter moscoviensis]